MPVYCIKEKRVTHPREIGVTARMEQDAGFYTLKGYQRFDHVGNLTAAQEDYLEMICRMLRRQEPVRVNELADRLHVKPSSASKMLSLLKDDGYLSFERYGRITATQKGLAAGEYLLYRHAVLQEFLCALNGTESELTQVERIEHFIDRVTVENLERLTGRMKQREEKSE